MDMPVLGMVVGFGLLFLLLTWWAIWDIARKDFGKTEKIIWWIIVALLPFVGCAAYFLLGFRQGSRRDYMSFD